MALTGQVEYKTLYNTFLSNTKNYSEFINTGFIDIYQRKGHGVLEEVFKEVNYDWGNIMNTPVSIVGIPKNGLKRLDEKYTTLKNSITAETTNIQKQLPEEAGTLDKEYVKKVLLKYAKNSWKDLRKLTTQFVIELRDNQLALSTSADKLNLVSSYMAGYLTGSSGNGLANFDLTSGSSITNLNTAASNTSSKLKEFCSEIDGIVSHKYNSQLEYPNEYLFFIDRLMNNEIIRYMDSHIRYPYAANLIRYRSDELIKELIKHRTKYKSGLSKDISEKYKLNLLKFSIVLLNYDTKKYEKYFAKYEIPNLIKQIKGIPKEIDKFEVNFTQNNSELSLVRRFFDSTIMGTANSGYNLKVIKNITIT